MYLTTTNTDWRDIMDFVYITAQNFGNLEECQKLVDRIASVTKYTAFARKDNMMHYNYDVIIPMIAIRDAGEFFTAVGADPETDWVEWTVRTAD